MKYPRRAALVLGLLAGLGFPAGIAQADNPDASAHWVFFDARPQTRAVEAITPRALARRARLGLSADSPDGGDRPVEPAYVDAVVQTGATLRHRSRWLHAVSVDADPETIARLRALPFVSELRPVAAGVRRDMTPRTATAEDDPIVGDSAEFLEAIGAHYLQGCGLTGDGVLVGVLDTGFSLTHDAMADVVVVGERDFVSDDGVVGIEDGDPGNAHWHGTAVLSTIAGNLDAYVGVAPGATFLLAKTEDVSVEEPIEEDNFVAGLEWIEAEGADLATASLGYIDWYTPEDLDGETAVTTIAVNAAVDKGLIVVAAAGNRGPEPQTLVAPADSPKVITVGALTKQLTLAGFSSRGPTADDRQKPDVTAPGVNVVTVDPDDDSAYVEVSGTSLATPLVAGVTALLVEAYPNESAEGIRTLLYETAAMAGAPSAGEGFGLIGGQAAGLLFCSCLDVDDDGDLDTACGGTDCDDGDAEVGPGKDEICDGKDSDCDGVLPVEEDDADHDGYIPCDGDCDDENADVSPSAEEVCDNDRDDDCDGLEDLEDPDCSEDEETGGTDGAGDGAGDEAGPLDSGGDEGTGGESGAGATDGPGGCSCTAHTRGTGGGGASLLLGLVGLVWRRRRHLRS